MTLKEARTLTDGTTIVCVHENREFLKNGKEYKFHSLASYGEMLFIKDEKQGGIKGGYLLERFELLKNYKPCRKKISDII